jgi:hypothetical protein
MSTTNTKQELKFRKCSNLGCDVVIAFTRKTDGSNGWSAVEKDNLGQLVIHACKGTTIPKPQQPQTQQQQSSPTDDNNSDNRRLKDVMLLISKALEILKEVQGAQAT